MERYSDSAIEIINELHTERLDYESEYIPLINCAMQCKDYEDAEEQGLLVRPGDKVWLSIQSYQEICEATVIKVELNYYTNPTLWVTIEYQSKIIGKQEYKNRWDLMFGKTVFLTREEAEAALKGANR